MDLSPIITEVAHDCGGLSEMAELYGLKSVHDGGVLFCGVSEQQFAINGRTHAWPKGIKLTWSLADAGMRLGELSAADIKQCYAEAFAEVMAVCDVHAEYSPNAKTANFLATAARLDGRQGVLADHQIPFGRADQTLVGRYDVAERWVIAENPRAGEIDLKRVVTHELLHGWGLGHAAVDRRSPALIEPSYSLSVRDLQERDIAELVRRYGPSKRDRPPTAPPSIPTPTGTLQAKVEVTINGEVWRASGPLEKV